ncbi:MAG: hypothetical protein NVV73_23020 [Cellvibrionaceae bacterium]|nr:hypothetical protein [Cellvibrionaceae bacterium]
MFFRFLYSALTAVLLSIEAFAAPVAAPPDATPTELVAYSPVIFTGIASSTRYGFHDKKKMPYTFIQFSGVTYLRRDSALGDPSKGTVEISVAGGLRENLRLLEVDEMPKFDLGQRYLVFLRGGDWRLSPITASQQGVFRLHGRIADDALVLNYQGQPIARIDERKFVLAKEKSTNDSTGPAEEKLDDHQAGQLASLSGRAPKDTQQEGALSEKVDSEGDRAQEPDNTQGRFANFETIMTLSTLKTFIDQTAKKTAGMYPEAAQVSLTPVDPLGEQSMRALSPNTSGTVKDRLRSKTQSD